MYVYTYMNAFNLYSRHKRTHTESHTSKQKAPYVQNFQENSTLSAQIGVWVNLGTVCAPFGHSTMYVCKLSFYLIFLLESLHLPHSSTNRNRKGYLRSKAGAVASTENWVSALRMHNQCISSTPKRDTACVRETESELWEWEKTRQSHIVQRRWKHCHALN